MGFESCYDFCITPGLPVVIRSQITNFKRLTCHLPQPLDSDYWEALEQTTLFAITQIQGAVLGYCSHGEIIFVLKYSPEVDTTPWLGNNIQEVSSVTASLLTTGFHKAREIFGETLPLSGDPIFKTKSWGLPSWEEVVNFLIHRQDSSIKNSINRACGFELENKFGKAKASQLFRHKSYDEKEDMLLHHCGIDMYEYFPPNLIFGTAIYKVRTLSSEESSPRNRWQVNQDVPNFVEEKDFLRAIFSNGMDIFRASELETLVSHE